MITYTWYSLRKADRNKLDTGSVELTAKHSMSGKLLISLVAMKGTDMGYHIKKASVTNDIQFLLKM